MTGLKIRESWIDEKFMIYDKKMKKSTYRVYRDIVCFDPHKRKII